VLVLACALFLDSEKAFDRTLFGSIVIVMIGNYLFFRLTDTLPQFQWNAYALWPRVYLAFETVIILYTILSIVFFFRRSDRSGDADASQRSLESAIAKGEPVPGVDVLICTYNEDLVILERTILAAKAIDYPNFNVYVLDDGRRPWLADFCAEVDVHYVTRPDNKGAKGGNINHGLERSAAISNAPYILILDADFAPQRPILKRIVGQFSDPSIGVVQTPQFYYNADPVQHNLLAKDAWVDDQRIFFDVMQPSKDAWGAAFCVGTSCVVRRDALALIGGMPHETVTEDIHLTYRLLQKGLKTRWLNERLSVGFPPKACPATSPSAAAGASARSRWRS
jgi:cellulose synthase (UDP-forming)